MLGKLICWWTGKHKRGVRYEAGGYAGLELLDHFKCPRCRATWSRKPRNRKATAP